MATDPVKRKLAAILSADVQGYSRLMGEDEVATIRTLTAYMQLMTDLVQQHHGRVVDAPGDNLLAEFASAVNAVEGAIAIQKELKAKNADLSPERQMHYRIGINMGDVVVEGEKIYGDAVNVAARLESLAEGGGICISEAVHMQVKNKLSLNFAYQGEQTVKNIAEPVRVYAVQPDVDSPAVSSGRRSSKSQLLSRSWLSRISAICGVLVILGIGYFVWQQTERTVDTPPPTSQLEEVLPTDKPTIAVLPFTNMSGDPQQEYFSDGMTETLITDLSKLPQLLVIARHSTFTYKGKAKTVQDIGRELGVQYIVEGSLQKDNDRLRLNVQLINALTDKHIWADRYDRELTDIFAVQDELAQKIVLALQVKLTPEQQANLRRFPTESLEAYEYFMRADEQQQRNTRDGTVQALQLLEQALALDPQYAAAYALRSLSYVGDWILQWSIDPQPLEKALEFAERAVALNDTLALPHSILGFCYGLKGNRLQALQEAKQAIALDPNFAYGHAMLANLHVQFEYPRGALSALEHAMRLNPRPPGWYFFVLGLAHAQMRETDKAITALKRAVALDPNDIVSYVNMAVIYAFENREAEAQAAAAEVLKINPAFSSEEFIQRLPSTLSTIRREWMLEMLRVAGLE